MREIRAIGVLHTYEARSVRSSKACSGSLSKIAYFCKAASRAASFVDMLGVLMPEPPEKRQPLYVASYSISSLASTIAPIPEPKRRSYD
jgi:hypothetical protein